MATPANPVGFGVRWVSGALKEGASTGFKAVIAISGESPGVCAGVRCFWRHLHRHSDLLGSPEEEGKHVPKIFADLVPRVLLAKRTEMLFISGPLTPPILNRSPGKEVRA